MRRILVAQSVGLWIRLNRHFSGVSAVDLVETPTLEGGRLLAQLERPSLVVFGKEAGREQAQSLIESLERGGCRETRVVLACEGLEPTPRPPSVEDRSLVICRPEDLIHVTTQLLALGEQPAGTLDLLVHYRTGSATGTGEGFVILLDLDEKQLLLQADCVLEVGSTLALDFLLPGPSPDAPRERVSLVCRVESCGDEDDLIYTARVSSIEPQALAILQRFLGTSGS